MRLLGSFIVAVAGLAPAAYASGTTLMCSGTQYHYEQGSSQPLEIPGAFLTVQIDEPANRLKIEGSFGEIEAGVLQTSQQFYSSAIPMPFSFNGVQYAYLHVTLNRYDGSIMLLTGRAPKPIHQEMVLPRFMGQCSRQQQKF